MTTVVALATLEAAQHQAAARIIAIIGLLAVAIGIWRHFLL